MAPLKIKYDVFSKYALISTLGILAVPLAFIASGYLAHLRADRVTGLSPDPGSIDRELLAETALVFEPGFAPGQGYSGRGLAVKETKAIVTNYHIVEEINRPPTSSQVTMLIKRGVGSTKQDRFISDMCFAWLDLCVLQPFDLALVEPKDRDRIIERSADAVEAGADVFFFPGAAYRSTLQKQQGKILQVSPTLIRMRLGVKKGHSGSPVYASDGSVVGIVARGADTVPGFHFLLRTIGLDPVGLYYPEAEVIPMEVIRRLRPCLAPDAFETDDCIRAQSELFLDQLAWNMADFKHERFFAMHDLRDFVATFARSFRVQAAALPMETRFQLPKLVASFELIYPGCTVRNDAVVDAKDLLYRKIFAVISSMDQYHGGMTRRERDIMIHASALAGAGIEDPTHWQFFDAWQKFLAAALK